MKKTISKILIFSVLLMYGSFFNVQTAQAATVNYYVDPAGTDDWGWGTSSGAGAWATIQYAISNVDNPTTDTIIINISGDTYTTWNNDIDINRSFTDLTLQGAGAQSTIVQSDIDPASSSASVFDIEDANNTTFEDMTIRYGRGSSGAAIEAANGDLTIRNCIIHDNDSPGDFTFGGIRSGGNIVIENSTFYDNDGYISGAVYSTGGGNPTCTITNSTFYNNTSSTAALYIQSSDVTITNTIITKGDALYFEGNRTHYIKNSIIANNDQGTYDIEYAGFTGSIVESNNIIGNEDGDAFFTDGVNDTSVDDSYTIAGIGLNSSLSENGSANGTLTLAVETGSMAINAGDDTAHNGVSIPVVDQRSASRVGIVDIGPYEYGGVVGVPTVSLLSPLDESIGVSTTSNLVIEFNKEVDAETGNIILYKSDDTLVEQFDVTSDISGSGTDTITINPSSDLAEQTSYYVQVDATAFDDASGDSFAGILDETTWNFTTADETNPSVSILSPVDDATNVATSANLVMTFIENVDVETGNIVIYKSSDDSVFETIDVTSGKVTGTGTDTIIINPSGTFAEQTAYYVKIDATAFDDTSGNSFAGITSKTAWNFTIGDFTNPTVSSFSPVDGIIDVTINSNLVITFAEAVNAESGNIVIYKASDNSIFETIAVTSDQVTGSGTSTITIDPTDSFATETGYYVKIAATAFDDTDGNSFAGIANSTTWNFTTIEGEEDNESIEADDGGTYSTDNTVVLNILGTNTLSEVSEMIISESPNFTGAEWEDFDSEKSFYLSDGDGVKAIYIKYRDSNGNESEIFVDYIIVDTVMTMELGALSGQAFSTEATEFETTDTTPTFSGTAETNSTIEITVLSDPVTTTLTVDESGEWSWTPDEELDIGAHTVTITGTDPAGNSDVISFTLNIIAEDIFEQEPAEEETEEETEETTDATLVTGDELPTSGLPTIFWGFVIEILLIIGFFLSVYLLPRKRESQF